MVDECEGCTNVEVGRVAQAKTRRLRRGGRFVSKIAMETKNEKSDKLQKSE